MAISTTIADNILIDELLLDGYKKAALVPIDFGIADITWAAKAAHGRRTLNRLLSSVSTERFFEYFVNLDVIELTAGEHQYELDVDILNIVDDGSYIPASNDPEEEETTGETPVKPLSGYRWNQLSAKSSTGTPVYYFIERNASQLLMRLWPVPSEAGKVRFRTHRIPGSSSNGANFPDFKKHWEQWAVLALAYEFMTDSSMPLDERRTMRDDRDIAFEKLKAYDTNNTPPEVVFSHSTPWGNQWRA